jgi:hypothetical protein
LSCVVCSCGRRCSCMTGISMPCTLTIQHNKRSDSSCMCAAACALWSEVDQRPWWAARALHAWTLVGCMHGGPPERCMHGCCTSCSARACMLNTWDALYDCGRCIRQAQHADGTPDEVVVEGWVVCKPAPCRRLGCVQACTMCLVTDNRLQMPSDGHPHGMPGSAAMHRHRAVAG